MPCLSVTVWYGSCTALERKQLARVVRTAQGIVGCPLPDLDSIYAGRVTKRARSIATDPSHPGHRLFVPLPSGKRYRNIRTTANRLRDSFFPRAVRAITPCSLPHTPHHPSDTHTQTPPRQQYTYTHLPLQPHKGIQTHTHPHSHTHFPPMMPHPSIPTMNKRHHLHSHLPPSPSSAALLYCTVLLLHRLYCIVPIAFLQHSTVFYCILVVPYSILLHLIALLL